MSLLVALPSFAAGYGSAGCGLGSLVIEEDNTWWKQVIAATLNGTGVQTFGISTGTSNCDSPTPMKTAQVESYVEANRMALAKDIARGQGETIANLASVYGCKSSKTFGKALKSNYRSIFSSTSTTHSEVATRIGGVAQTVCHKAI